MSDDLAKQVAETRAARDNALGIVKEDISALKSDYAQKSIKERATDKLKGGASGIYSEAVDVASDHRGVIAAVVAALVIWFARHPILSLFTGSRDDDEDEEDNDEAGSRSVFGYGR